MIRTLTTILQEKGKMPRTDNTIFSLTLNGSFFGSRDSNYRYGKKRGKASQRSEFISESF